LCCCCRYSFLLELFFSLTLYEKKLTKMLLFVEERRGKKTMVKVVFRGY